MSALSESMNFEPMRELPYSSITTSYVLVGNPADPAVRIAIVTNFTNVNLNFSVDGIDDHFALGPSSTMTLDLVANKTQKGFYMGVRKAIYVKYRDIAPSSGFVMFSTIYGETRSTL